VTLKETRQRRDDARKLIANNLGPSEHRKPEKAASQRRVANRFELVAREWFNKHAEH